METKNRPTLTLHTKGENSKILEVSGPKGAVMPLHHCTGEAVVIIVKGIAVIHINGKEQMLKGPDALIIPSGQDHSLSVKEDFNAFIVMPPECEIEFSK